MARICAVCQLAPREGTVMRPIRLRDDTDLQNFEKVTELALYSACTDCVDIHRKHYAEKHQIPIEKITNNMMC